MDTPHKKTNYTGFEDISGANQYARAVDKDLQNIFNYVDGMGVTKTVTIAGTTLTIENGVITKVT